MMEVTREHFDKLLKKYEQYCDLYRYFNGGSLDGVTPLGEFYWRLTYHVKYQDPSKVGNGGY